MPELSAYGLTVDPPSGWEGRIFRRVESGELRAAEVSGPPAPVGELTFAVVHVATIPIPVDMADYGSDVVSELGPDDALVVLKEFEPASASQPLFASPGMPSRLDPGAFDPATLQRRLDGQAGYQVFFNEAGRAFCLYVVLGAYDRRVTTVERVNDVLSTMSIEAGAQ